jgi:hypothetical protein
MFFEKPVAEGNDFAARFDIGRLNEPVVRARELLYVSHHELLRVMNCARRI